MALRRLALYWLAPALYLVLIFALSGMSRPPVPPGVDSNLLHYPEYAVLGLLFARALQGERRGRASLGALLAAVGLCAFWGATDEIHQAFVPGRVPDPLDWWHDVVGAAAGAALWGIWKAWWP